MKAYRITDWFRYEVDKDGHAVSVPTPIDSLRIAPLPYVRWRVNGHRQGDGYGRLAEAAGSASRLEAAICTFGRLIELAADENREYRGWILNHRKEPATMADLVRYTKFRAKTLEIGLEVLCHVDAHWLESVEFTPSQCAPMRSDAHQHAKSAVLQNENETKTKTKSNGNELNEEAERKVSQGSSVSVSKNRKVERAKWHLAIEPFWAVGGTQRVSDETSTINLFDDLWPEDADPEISAKALAEVMADLLRIGRGGRNKMACLTEKVKSVVTQLEGKEAVTQ